MEFVKFKRAVHAQFNQLAAGGQTEGFLRCSLAWSNYDDLDLHVVEPSYNEIYYSNRTGKSGRNI